MRSLGVRLFLVTVLILTISPGCSVWRQASRPELWGMSLPETWDYDMLRSSGVSHSEARRIIRQKRTEASVTERHAGAEIGAATHADVLR